MNTQISVQIRHQLIRYDHQTATFKECLCVVKRRGRESTVSGRQRGEAERMEESISPAELR